MAINSRIKDLLNRHRNVWDIASFMTDLDLRGSALLRAMGKSNSILPLPVDGSATELSKWIKEVRRRNPSVYRSLIGNTFVTDVSKHLSVLKDNWLKSTFMQQLKKDKPQAWNKIVTTYEDGDKYVLGALERRKAFADQHFKFVEEARFARTGRKSVLSKEQNTVNNLVVGTAGQARANIIRQIGNPTTSDFKKWEGLYKSSATRSNASELQAAEREIAEIISKIKQLPAPIQKILNSANAVEASNALDDLLNVLPKDSFTVAAKNSLMLEFRKVRKLTKAVYFYNTQIVESMATLSTGNIAPGQIRDSFVLSREVIKLLNAGDLRGIRNIGTKLHPKRAKDLIKKLGKESKVLGLLVSYAVNDPAKVDMPKVQAAYKKEVNHRELAIFKKDDDQILRAFKDKALMDRMIKIGFDPKAYVRTAAGARTIAAIGNEIVESNLLKKENVLRLVSENSAISKMKKQGIKSVDKFKAYVSKIIGEKIKQEGESILVAWSKNQGDVLENAMGKDFLSKFLPFVQNKYFEYAFSSSMQEFVFTKVKDRVQVSVDPFLINIQESASFGKKIRMFGINNIYDLQKKVREELERVHRGDGGKMVVCNYIQNILSLSSLSVRLKNMPIINAMEDIIKDNKVLFNLYVSGRRDGTTSMNELTPRKQKEEQIKKRKEMNPEARRERESKEFKKQAIREAKDKSKRVRDLTSLGESTIGKVGIEKNYHLRKMREASQLHFIQQGYTGKELQDVVNEQMSMYTRRLRFQIGKRINALPEMKEARKSASITKYMNRYMELQNMFTRQDDISRDPRNSALNQERDRLKAQTDPLNSEYDSFVQMGRRGDFIAMRGRASIPTLIQEATTLDQLNEIRAHINDVIPLKYFKTSEFLNANDFKGYVIKQDPITGADVTVPTLMEFMDFHALRIDKNATTRDRIEEKEGILRTEGTTPINNWTDLNRR
jgi:hypothetical protein